MRDSKTYSAVVIGAGGIACGYDAPGAEATLTHVHALIRHPRFRCAGLFDRDPQRLRQACDKWGVEGWASFGQLMDVAPDMAIVAVPDEWHQDYLVRLLPYGPRVVLCEKPLTLDVRASEALTDQYETAKIPLLVNYQRRFDPTVRALRAAISSGETGKPLAGALWYSKGIRHNGSHGIDTLRFLFGEVRSFGVTGRRIDWKAEDPVVSGHVRFDDVTIQLIGADERCFSLFELDLLFERCRYRFLHSGLSYEISRVKPDPVFPGYQELFPEVSGKTGLDRALTGALDEIAALLDTGREPGNSARNILATQKICEQLANAPVAGT